LTPHVALRISRCGRFETETIPTRRPLQGEILVSPISVGICGTDLDIVRRTRPDMASILGHEGVGAIVEVGPGVTSYAEGERVVFNPVDPFNHDNILGHSAEGLFQRRLLVSHYEEDRGLLMPFDMRIPELCGPLVEPLGTVIYGQSLVGLECDQKTIAVVGAGPIGQLHALHARSSGCPDVFLIDHSKERLHYAVEHNVVTRHEAVISSGGFAKVILDRTGGEGVDALYLCTTRASARSALRESILCVRAGGCIDLVVGFEDGAQIPELRNVDLNAIRRANTCGLTQAGFPTRGPRTGGDVSIVGHRGTSVDHFRGAMDCLVAEPARYASVISHIVSLSEAPSVLEHLATQKFTRIQGRVCLKVIIDMSEGAPSIRLGPLDETTHGH
jgi:threonine dehydrogenase-like Zn-dependent dehydrogenase